MEADRGYRSTVLINELISFVSQSGKNFNVHDMISYNYQLALK